jgi:preprotein translocase subunit YajC
MNETATAAPAATATTAQPAATPAAQPQQSGFGMFVPMLLILAIFYFMMIRPQQRKEKERRKMIDELRAGAKIVFAGGLMGTIQEATEKTFKVEIAPGTVIEISRASVQCVVGEEGNAK